MASFVSRNYLLIRGNNSLSHKNYISYFYNFSLKTPTYPIAIVVCDIMNKYLFTFTVICFFFFNNTTSLKYNKTETDKHIKRNVLYYIDSNGTLVPLDLNENQPVSEELIEFYRVERELQNKNTPANSAKSLISLAIAKCVRSLGWSSKDLPYKFTFYREDVTFTLYTREFAKKGINLTKNYHYKDLDINKLTKILFHGYQQNGTTDTPMAIKDNYLKVSDINVIVVDYHSVASKVYFASVSSLGPVADFCAEFFAYLFNYIGVKPKKTHFIGHSLGGQLAGFTGKRLIVFWMKKIERITGLDPAGPLFELAHLNQRDAKFVDIIHTDGKGFGLDLAAGHIDFYPNGGYNPQPNCTNESFKKSNSCSHKQSWLMYVQTIVNENLYIAKCTDDKRFPMGSATPSYARGNCTLQTSKYRSFNEIELTEYNLFDFITFLPVRTFDYFWDLLS